VAADGRPHVLFVYYSFTQQTRTVADAMAEALRGRGCEVTEAAIEFPDKRYGKRFSKRPMDWPILKIFGMLPAQARKKTGEIRIPPEAADGSYDLVVGSPTWWLTTCMPVRTYMHDPASQKVLGGTPFAVFTTSRRYYKGNIDPAARRKERRPVRRRHALCGRRQPGDLDVVVVGVHAARQGAGALTRLRPAETQSAARIREACQRLHQRRGGQGHHVRVHPGILTSRGTGARQPNITNPGKAHMCRRRSAIRCGG
jgi:hypothetical protein